MSWHEWPIGDAEVHIVPEAERKRHRPQECWCGPVTEPRADCKTVVRHRERGDDFRARARRSA